MLSWTQRIRRAVLNGGVPAVTHALHERAERLPVPLEEHLLGSSGWIRVTAAWTAPATQHHAATVSNTAALGLHDPKTPCEFTTDSAWDFPPRSRPWHAPKRVHTHPRAARSVARLQVLGVLQARVHLEVRQAVLHGREVPRSDGAHGRGDGVAKVETAAASAKWRTLAHAKRELEDGKGKKLSRCRVLNNQKWRSLHVRKDRGRVPVSPIAAVIVRVCLVEVREKGRLAHSTNTA